MLVAKICRPILRVRRFSTQVVPFKIKQFEAFVLLNTRRFFEPSDVTPTKKNVKENFIPFHAVSISGLNASYTCTVGDNVEESYDDETYDAINKCWKKETHTRTVTKWRNGYKIGNTPNTNYSLQLPQMQVYAGFNYPREKVESVMCGDLVQHRVELVNELVKDKIIESVEMSSEYSMKIVQERLHPIEKSRTEKYILKEYSADVVKFDNFDVGFYIANKQLHTVYLPIYVHTYEHQNTNFYKFVNGYTGTTDGEQAYAIGKMFAVFSTLGAALPLLSLFLGPVGRVVMLSRMAFGVAMSTLPVIWARFWSHYKKKKNMEALESEREINKKFLKSDIKQVEIELPVVMESGKEEMAPVIIDVLNENTDNNDQKEMYVLLGLDPIKPFTMEQLDEAYKQQRQNAHQYKEDNKMARKISMQLLEAYEILKQNAKN